MCIVDCDILHLKMLDINVEYLGTNPKIHLQIISKYYKYIMLGQNQGL
jgi:hypothetical protein